MVNKEKWPHKVSFHLNSEQFENLKNECENNDITMSDFFRLAVENIPYIISPKKMKLPENVVKNILSSISTIETDLKSYFKTQN